MTDNAMAETADPKTRPPRRPRADGERTRGAILRAAASLATVDGLEGLSIGHLAAALGMSKSGLYAHFGSKQELQLATVEEAGRIFDAEVVQPALAAPPGVAQLEALCEAFFEHLQRHTFPGGCFFSGAVLEMGTRPGPVKEAVAAFQAAFVDLLRGWPPERRGRLAEGPRPAGDPLRWRTLGGLAHDELRLEDDLTVLVSAVAGGLVEEQPGGGAADLVAWLAHRSG